MKQQVPHTPFSTPLSGSAREVELRLKNIMSGPKKRPPALFLALIFAVCVFCGNLVSCQNAEPEEPEVTQTGPNASILGTSSIPEEDWRPDLNQNGIPENVRLLAAYGDWEIQFREGDELIDREVPDVWLCRLDGTDYILRHNVDEYQGRFSYSYQLADFSGEFEETPQWNDVQFDINFNTLFHKSFDPESIAAYVDELNELLAHSVRLTNADGELQLEPGQPVTLPWLDNFPDVFTRDPEKSLLENLRDFQAAMPQGLASPAGEPVAALPFDQPIEMTFASGAGSWRTVLTLHPDGSFQGDYCDADMEIHYVCQFHGRFGNMVPISDTSFYMTLEELVLDTEYPVGQEWDADGIHFISTDPYGLNGTDGKALQPGAGFVFYLPQATGHELGTDLYGAFDFWTWWPNRRNMDSAADTLGCYGLHNPETGYGFFSEP